MKPLNIAVWLAALALLATPALADWDPGDPYKMHFPQLPDPNGWDVDITTDFIYDDWMCTETGPVSDIHFWASWMGDRQSPLLFIDIEIWTDMPIDDPNNNLDISHPLEEVWSRRLHPGEFRVRGPFDGDQGWFSPTPPDQPIVNPIDHQMYWQVNIDPILDPFIQEEGKIYWLGIHAGPEDPSTAMGWKTSQDHWNDDAVYWYTILGHPGPHCAQTDRPRDRRIA